MKNGTHPLYTLLRDPKPIATNGNAKKHTARIRRRILLGGLIAITLGIGVWQFNGYQDSQRREQFITWVAKYRPAWSSSTIKAEWDKIQYAREHAEIVAPVSTHAYVPIPAATPVAVLVPLNSEPKESPKPADMPGGYWVESDNPQIGWHWIKGSPSKSGRFTDR